MNKSAVTYMDFMSGAEMLQAAEDAMSGACPHLHEHASPKSSAADLARIAAKLRIDRFYSSRSVVPGVSVVHYRPLADRLPIWG